MKALYPAINVIVLLIAVPALMAWEFVKSKLGEGNELRQEAA